MDNVFNYNEHEVSAHMHEKNRYEGDYLNGYVHAVERLLIELYGKQGYDSTRSQFKPTKRVKP